MAHPVLDSLDGDSKCYRRFVRSSLEERFARLIEAGARADLLRDTAHALLIDAVHDAVEAGASQRQIAERLGRSQPEVSRLAKLAREEFRGTTRLGRLVREHRTAIRRAVREAGASNARVFGSVARGEDDEQSDVDILVDIPDDFTLFDLGDLTVRVGDILGVPVDVVPTRGLKGKIRSTALNEAATL